MSPSPVAKIWIGVPRIAGLDELFSELSALRTAPPPVPVWSTVKIAGALAADGTAHWAVEAFTF